MSATTPPPEARSTLGIYHTTIHVDGHEIILTTYGGSGQVEATTVTDPDTGKERWVGTIFRLGRIRQERNKSYWPPLLRWNNYDRSWLGRGDNDPIGADARKTIVTEAEKLWRTCVGRWMDGWEGDDER